MIFLCIICPEMSGYKPLFMVMYILPKRKGQKI